MTISNRMRKFFITPALICLFLLSSCSTMNIIPPEVNLMGVDVHDVTLSHVNFLADIKLFNPNNDAVTIQGVDYILLLEGIKVFSGKSNQPLTIAPQEYAKLGLRLSSAYWDIIQILNTLPDKTDVVFSMQGSIRVGGEGLFARRYSFNREGVIPVQKLLQ